MQQVESLPMQLDVIVATCNRQELLKRALNSLLAAEVPPALDVRIIVVDNNSKDETRQVVESLMARSRGQISYLFEGQQGKPYALNAGIAATSGDLVGMIDDDEEIDARWYACVDSAFRQNSIDFIGGPYIPRWGAECPSWFPPNYKGVIGWVDGGDKVQVFGEDYSGILMGGNAVIRRSIIEKVGPYSTVLNRTHKRLMACEDEDIYHRLLAVGARGLYLPDLIIYHYIPPERLTKRYFRRWCFWRGVSRGLIDRERREPVSYFGGVPRYLYGQAARGLVRLVRGIHKKERDVTQNFTDELAAWDLIGFFYGKHFYKPLR